MSTVVTLTLNPCLDQITGVGRVRPNRKLRMDQPGYEPGGGGVNVSRAITRLGGDTLACYAAGGPTGERLGELLDDEGVSQLRVPFDGYTRINPNVFEHDTDDLYRFMMPGPELDPQVVDRCFERITELQASFGYVVISGSLPEGLPDHTYRSLIESLRRDGKRVLLDASGPPLKAGIHGGPHLVKPNYHELAELIGEEPESDEAVERGARGLIDEHGVKVVFVSLGAAGATVVEASRAWRIHPPTVNVRSRIGAGDSVVAGMSMRLAEGWELADAARFGVAAGAAAVMTPGTELCRREDTQRLFEEMSAKRGMEADHD